MGLATLAGFATVASSVGLLATSAYIIARAALQPSIAELQTAIVAVRFFGITRGAVRYAERLLSHDVAFRLITRLRVWFYRKLEPLAPGRLMQYRSGDLLQRIVGDVDTLENFYVRIIAPPLVALSITALTLVLLASFSLKLAFAIAGIHVVIGVAVPLMTLHTNRRTGRRLAEVQGSLKAAFVDTVQASDDILAFGQEKRRLALLQSLSQKLADLQIRVAIREALSTALVDLSANVATLTALTISIPLIRQGQVDGVFLAVIILTTMAGFEALAPLSATFLHLEQQTAAASRLFDIIDASPLVQDAPASVTPPTDPSLTFEGVRFRYDASLPFALDRIGFELPPGGKIAIVGPNGSGKTSIVNLLLRFWDHKEGTIRIGDHAIGDYRQEDVRRLMSVVNQPAQFLNGTIRDNLLLARGDADPSQLEHAAHQAQILAFIQSLPAGFDTQIGEGGLLLSAGERQRLAIARAVLKNAPILILDEPAAHLDADNEQAIMTNLLTWAENRSVLLITHRLVGLDRMHEILVLGEGRTLERGSHAKLIESKGAYWRMWSLQTQSDLIETIGES